MNDTTVKSKSLPIFRWFVYIAGMLVGGGFGAIAGMAAGNGALPGVLLGIGLGAVGGLLAGLLWCRIILGRRPLQRSRTRSNIICLLGGPFAGILVGWMATILLWLGLSLAPSPPAKLEPHGITFLGLAIAAVIFFATPAGAAMGTICGIIAAIATWRAFRRMTSD